MSEYFHKIGRSIGTGVTAIGNRSGSRGWTARYINNDDVLFFAETKNIADGKLYNEKKDATDYLTVTGSAGSYAFECPNTAPYIAADTDRVWFNTDTNQRIPTEAELIGYDFGRTIIKYPDSSPYSIEAIMILSSDVDTAQMRDDFHLSIWWDDTLSLHGSTKGNRLSERSVWVNAVSVISDGSTKFWGDSQDLTTLTKDAGTGAVSLWKDKLGGGNDLEGGVAGTYPIWSADGILGDGSNDVLKKVFTYNAPQFIYLVFKQVTWTINDCIVDGGQNVEMKLFQYSGTPKLVIRGLLITDVPVDTWVILRIQLKTGANKGIVNNGIPVTSSNAAGDMHGLSLLAQYNNASASNVQIKEIIARSVDETSANETLIYNYLANKYGFTTI